MKERVRVNRIDVLYNGDRLTDVNDIKSEILLFYKQLLGSAAHSLPGVHLPTLRSGNTLSLEDRRWLCRTVSESEI